MLSVNHFAENSKQGSAPNFLSFDNDANFKSQHVTSLEGFQLRVTAANNRIFWTEVAKSTSYAVAR
jgi:hypothetical protein